MVVSEYLAIPVKAGGRSWDAVDCWGLMVLIYREKLGIELPLYIGTDWFMDAKVYETIERRARRDWIEVPVAERREGDGVALRVRGMPWHVGVVIDAKSFIHADPERGVCIERFDSLHWKNRVVGIFRLPEQNPYVALTASPA